MNILEGLRGHAHLSIQFVRLFSFRLIRESIGFVDRQQIFSLYIENDKSNIRIIFGIETATADMKTVETPPVVEIEKEDTLLPFEETTEEPEFRFPTYRIAETPIPSRKPWNFSYVKMVRDILEVETPLSEEWLLKRTISCFNSERVTSSVRSAFERCMFGCQREGIIRKNGFLYLEGRNNYEFRLPSQNAQREIKHIAPEELAAGFYALIKQNVSIERASLYRIIAGKCGFSRVGKNIQVLFDDAITLLDSIVNIEGDIISIK